MNVEGSMSATNYQEPRPPQGAPLAVCLNDCDLDYGQPCGELASICFRVGCAFAGMRWGISAASEGVTMNSPDEKVLVERQSPYHYTQDGMELKERAEQALVPLFGEFMDRGYSPYQICAVIYDSVAETSREIVSIHKSAGRDAANQILKEKIKQ